MVWFQCEDCGDNLKKPKLPNHFRVCSAIKLSCIDCGEVFGQQTVEAHTQCISEAEKYGPKGVGKAPNGKTIKPKDDAKQRPEVDINVGLSERPPWFCSLCNTKATSKQTLLLHAEGKKHRAKARGFHASKQQSTNTVDTKDVTENNERVEHLETNIAVESGDKNSSKFNSLHDRSGAESHVLPSNKKRKCDLPDERADAKQKSGGDVSTEPKNGTLNQTKGTEEVTKGWKKVKNSSSEEDAALDSTSEKENLKKEIKWKKLIILALKSNSDAVLKLKELRKLVLKSIEASGFTVDDKHQVYEMLERKLNSSSRFTVNGKYVSLVANS